MGFPDSPKFLTEKDSHIVAECNIVSRPTLEIHQQACQIAPPSSNESDQRKQEEAQERKKTRDHQKEESSRVSFPSLKVKLLKMVDEEDDEGCTTPTSAEHKIPQVCPPAPKKPKPIPSTTNGKGCRRRVLLDLSNEIESLFPEAMLADFGKKIKKARKESLPIQQ